MAVLGLLAQIGNGLRLLSKYYCSEASEAFRKLPVEQFQTAYILCLMGRCHYEMVEYVEAERYFQWSRRLSPDRLEGLEVYSTVLWHLRKHVELSYLAQEAIALDRFSPQANKAMQEIRDVVSNELNAVNVLIIEQLKSDVEMVENVGQYIVDAGGKRLRPLVALLAASALGSVQQSQIKCCPPQRSRRGGRRETQAYCRHAQLPCYQPPRRARDPKCRCQANV